MWNSNSISVKQLKSLKALKSFKDFKAWIELFFSYVCKKVSSPRDLLEFRFLLGTSLEEGAVEVLANITFFSTFLTWITF